MPGQKVGGDRVQVSGSNLEPYAALALFPKHPMGRLRRSRTHKAQRDVHRASRTRVRGRPCTRGATNTRDAQRSQKKLMSLRQARTRDLDQIQLHDLRPAIRAALENQPLDSEKPGLAQHYCVECARYFEVSSSSRIHSPHASQTLFYRAMWPSDRTGAPSFINGVSSDSRNLRIRLKRQNAPLVWAEKSGNQLFQPLPDAICEGGVIRH